MSTQRAQRFGHLSVHELAQTATIQFDLGEGGSMSIIHFLIILCLS